MKESAMRIWCNMWDGAYDVTVVVYVGRRKSVKLYIMVWRNLGTRPKAGLFCLKLNHWQRLHLHLETVLYPMTIGQPNSDSLCSYFTWFVIKIMKIVTCLGQPSWHTSKKNSVYASDHRTRGLDYCFRRQKENPELYNNKRICDKCWQHTTIKKSEGIFVCISCVLGYSSVYTPVYSECCYSSFISSINTASWPFCYENR